jgi:hypothetical protein
VEQQAQFAAEQTAQQEQIRLQAERARLAMQNTPPASQQATSQPQQQQQQQQPQQPQQPAGNEKSANIFSNELYMY